MSGSILWRQTLSKLISVFGPLVALLFFIFIDFSLLFFDLVVQLLDLFFNIFNFTISTIILTIIF